MARSPDPPGRKGRAERSRRPGARREEEMEVRPPDLHAPTPDPGRVHPYGDVLSEAENGGPHPDLQTWTCSSCGYQWERRRAPEQCPNCALTDTFVKPG